LSIKPCWNCSHTDLVDDVVDYINEIANAEAGLEILSRVVKDDPTGSEEE